MVDMITCGLWSPRSPDLNVCYFCLWQTLKGRVFVNSQPLQELKTVFEDKLLIFLDQSSIAC
jgi:hypothetical protein